MSPQFFSEKMSHHLSSLVPGFEGHYYHIKRRNANTGDIAWFVYCRAEIEEGRVYLSKESRFVFMRDYIIEKFPAWQVEDVLSNLEFIIDRKIYLENEQKLRGLLPGITQKISSLLVRHPDTAYQKIEEYLWIILK